MTTPNHATGFTHQDPSMTTTAHHHARTTSTRVESSPAPDATGITTRIARWSRRLLTAARRPVVAAVAVLATGVMGTGVVADTIIVAQDGTGDYESLVAAVSASADGDTILVYPGHYIESTWMRPNDRYLEIVGVDGPESTLVQVTSSYTLSDCYRGVRFSGFTVLGNNAGGSSIGVRVANQQSDSLGAIIDNCRFVSTNSPFQLFSGPSDHLIANCEFLSCGSSSVSGATVIQ